MAPRAPWWPACGGKCLNVVLGRAVRSRRDRPGDGTEAQSAVKIADIQELHLAQAWGEAEGILCGLRGPE